MEEDGKAKTIGKMSTAERCFTGTMPFMFPGMAGEKQRYEHEREAYYDQQNQMRTQNSPGIQRLRGYALRRRPKQRYKGAFDSMVPRLQELDI